MLSGQNSSSRMFAASASSAETDRRADFVPNSFDLRNLQEETLTFLLRQYFMSAASSQSMSMPPTNSTHLLMGTAPLSTGVGLGRIGSAWLLWSCNFRRDDSGFQRFPPTNLMPRVGVLFRRSRRNGLNIGTSSVGVSLVSFG